MKIDFKIQLVDADFEPAFIDKEKQDPLMANDFLRRHLFNRMKTNESDLDKYFNWGMDLKDGVIDLDKNGQNDLIKFIRDPETYMPVMYKGQLLKLIDDAKEK